MDDWCSWGATQGLLGVAPLALMLYRCLLLLVVSIRLCSLPQLVATSWVLPRDHQVGFAQGSPGGFCSTARVLLVGLSAWGSSAQCGQGALGCAGFWPGIIAWHLPGFFIKGLLCWCFPALQPLSVCA